MATTSIPLPPGPRSHPLIQGFRMITRPIPFFEECAARYGDCFTLRFPVGSPVVLFSAPDAVRQIFTGDEDRLRGGEANWVLRPLLGRHSLLVLDGDRHARERRLMMPPFHGARMLAYADVMRAVTAEAIARWPVGRPFPIHGEMQRITLEVILRTVFGLEDGAEQATLRDRLRRWAAGNANPALLWPALQVDLGRLSPWGRITRLRREIDALVRAEVVRRREQGETRRDDVLSLLLAARDEDGRPMADEELSDELLTLLVAGHETTATALAWALHRILTEDGVHDGIRTERERVVGDGPLAGEHIGQLDYLDATVKETLRLNPVVPDTGRHLARPMEIAGVTLPAGTVVAACIYLAHRRPDAWPEPERFRPERFVGARTNPYTFLPFGGGVRRCLGMAFAMYEMKVVLAEILSRVDLRVAPGYRARVIRRSITFAPSRGMPVVVDRVRDPRPAGASGPGRLLESLDTLESPLDGAASAGVASP